MKILALKETSLFEKRIAITPDMVKKYQQIGFEVFIEKDAGLNCNFSNQDFLNLNVKIIDNIAEILPQIDIIINVQNNHFPYHLAKDNAIFIGILNPNFNTEKINQLRQHKIKSFALELTPRITRAQNIDVLSSQSNLAGYISVIEAAKYLNRAIPMFMTAAGTLSAAKFMIIGAGVAGLQAIATAKRLGAIVSAFDVRAAAKEQVQSLGAKFIEVENVNNQYDIEAQKSAFYAQEMSEEYKLKQKDLLKKTIISQDVVIATALIQGKKSPILIDEEMVSQMKSGAIIVDLSASNGGNCQLTKINQIFTTENKVTIIGYDNFPSLVAIDASQLIARNIYNFINLLIDKEQQKIIINQQDEIIAATTI